MAIYETIFILDSLIPPKDIETTIQKYSTIISDNGGKIREVDKWGKRRLAYEIQKKQYGFYVAIEFEGAGTIPRLLESDYNYNDKVLRYLTYRYDKNKLKAMEMNQEKAEAKPVQNKPEIEFEDVNIDNITSEIMDDKAVSEDDSVNETQLNNEADEEAGQEIPDSEEKDEEDKS